MAPQKRVLDGKNKRKRWCAFKAFRRAGPTVAHWDPLSHFQPTFGIIIIVPRFSKIHKINKCGTH